MSIVGTQRVRATRCLIWVTRSSRALMGSLRMGSLRTEALRRAACAYARQSPVRPSQQPTLKRHRGHWNVPWRHSIAAAQRGHGSTAGSGVVPAGGGAAIRRRYGARRTAIERCGCPVPPRDTHLHGPPALRATRLSALPRPHARGRAMKGLVPRVERSESVDGPSSPFAYTPGRPRSRRARRGKSYAWSSRSTSSAMCTAAGSAHCSNSTSRSSSRISRNTHCTGRSSPIEGGS
jgi:hypothetical protein